VQVIPSDELVAATGDDPGIRRVTAGRVQMLVARLSSGEVVAFDTVCPHQLTDLEEAYFWEGRLRCSRHQYLYDLQSGENILPTREASPETLWKLKPGYLPTYEVDERDGWVWVDPAPRPPPPGYDPARERRPAAGERAGVQESEAADTRPFEHPTKTLKVREGASFELRIPTTPRPGFAWNVKVTGNAKVLVEGYLPGDQPRHRVRIQARRAGNAVVKCTFGRPWDETPAEVRTYVVQIVPQN
jgi:nitrite reductase/ring-hydroxylating ferredoxin subunit/predicted secreted protein